MIGQQCWADSPSFDNVYLEIEVNDGLGVLATKEPGELEPTVTFCSLFADPGHAFHAGKDERQFGMSLSQARQLLDQIESAFAQSEL